MFVRQLGNRLNCELSFGHYGGELVVDLDVFLLKVRVQIPLIPTLSFFAC